jgi:hypothetical protein
MHVDTLDWDFPNLRALGSTDSESEAARSEVGFAAELNLTQCTVTACEVWTLNQYCLARPGFGLSADLFYFWRILLPNLSRFSLPNLRPPLSLGQDH